MHFSFWSTLAMLPATAILLMHQSWLGLIYAASLLVTLLYHGTFEQRFRRLDHALAYGVVGANGWMAFHARDGRSSIAGVFLVLFALVWYHRAKSHPEEYDGAHGVWHLLCGLAGLAFAMGYVR